MKAVSQRWGKRPANIAEVAAAAGVAEATVSRVLNVTAPVREHTRRRVEEAMRALDYRPSQVARGLSRGRTMTVGVIAPFFTQPSGIELLRGADEFLTTTGYDIVLYNVGRPEQVLEQFQNVANGRTDGVLVMAMPPPEREVSRLLSRGVPVVLANFRHDGLTHTYIDDVAGGYMATKHLIELGHRRIAFVGDPSANPYGFTSSVDRCRGFRSAMAEAALSVPTEYVKEGPHARHVAHRLTSELLNLMEPPTAVVAAGDTLALGVLEAAENVGVDVPRGLSVIGFDDIEVAAYVGLTTIRSPLVLMGRRGAELLVEACAAQHQPTPVVAEQMPLELIVRKSTAPPR
jgi:LacI family transcriptional regulator